MKYTVVIHASDEGYGIACPALPGCWSQGKTEEEAVANIIEAIGDYAWCRTPTGERIFARLKSPCSGSCPGFPASTTARRFARCKKSGFRIAWEGGKHIVMSVEANSKLNQNLEWRNGIDALLSRFK